MPSEAQGNTSVESKKVNSVGSPYGAGEGGVGPELDPKGNRTSPLHSPSKK